MTVLQVTKMLEFTRLSTQERSNLVTKYFDQCSEIVDRDVEAIIIDIEDDVYEWPESGRK